MLYIETKSVDAAFHFSVEEYIVRHYPWDEPVLMIWQADKCAMIGSNQIAGLEIDLGCARREGVQIVRRSSGGGTIYTDLGTLLYTVIQPNTKEAYPLEIARRQVSEPVVEALREIGITASVEGRNDILVEGKKVSGLAQYTRHGRICTHGSLLYDADLEMLARVLRVDDEKIRSKALRSIRSRVTNIREYMSHECSTLEFLELLKKSLFERLQVRDFSLSEHDLSQIGQIFKEKYGDPAWTFEQSPKYSFHNGKRFPGGRVDVYLDIEKGAVSACSIRGDFLGVVPIRDLERVFENRLFKHQVFAEALEGISLQPHLGNITIDEFLSCMFD